MPLSTIAFVALAGAAGAAHLSKGRFVKRTPPALGEASTYAYFSIIASF